MQSFSMEYCSYASFFQFYFFPFFFFFPPVLCCCCCCCCAVAGVAAASTTGVSSASGIVISVFALLISLYSPAFSLLHRPRSLSLLPSPFSSSHIWIDGCYILPCFISGNAAISRPRLPMAATNLPTSAALSVLYFRVVPEIGS